MRAATRLPGVLALTAGLVIAASGISSAGTSENDIRGVYGGEIVSGKAMAPVELRITSEDPTTGAVAGTATLAKRSLPLTGTVHGSTGTLHMEGAGYWADVTIQVSGPKWSARMTGTFKDSENASGTLQAGQSAEPVALGIEDIASGSLGVLTADAAGYPVNVSCPAGPTCQIIASLTLPPATPGSQPALVGTVSRTIPPASLATVPIPISPEGRLALLGLTQGPLRGMPLAVQATVSQGTQRTSATLSASFDTRPVTWPPIPVLPSVVAPPSTTRWLVAGAVVAALLAVWGTRRWYEGWGIAQG